MDTESAGRLLAENIKTVFGFSVSKLQDETEAQELASRIVYKVLKSAPKLKNDDSFFAFMWRISETVYADYLREKRKYACEDISDVQYADDCRTVADEAVFREDMRLLSRELSLLSSQFRRATVMYYFDDLTCFQIAEKMNISTEMVKYYLFRARKILRKGMSMDRLFGEKSYNPVKFEIDFFGTCGGDDYEYRGFEERKLRGNILVAAYYSPVTLEELSVELGVAVTYFEDEIRLLEARKYLANKNGKYLTNIPVFTLEYAREREYRTKDIAENAACEFEKSVFSSFADRFGHMFLSENLMRWQIVMLCCHFAMEEQEKIFTDKYGEPPADGAYSVVNGGGGRGIVWGRCSAEGDEFERGIRGIYDNCFSSDGSCSVIAYNFIQILNGQFFRGDTVESLSTLANGHDDFSDDIRQRLSLEGYITENGNLNIPVYSESEYRELKMILRDGVKIFSEVMGSIREISAKTAAEHAPEHIKNLAEYTAAFISGFDCFTYIVRELYNSGWIKNVGGTDKPAMCIVKHNT